MMELIAYCQGSEAELKGWSECLHTTHSSVINHMENSLFQLHRLEARIRPLPSKALSNICQVVPFSWGLPTQQPRAWTTNTQPFHQQDREALKWFGNTELSENRISNILITVLSKCFAAVLVHPNPLAAQISFYYRSIFSLSLHSRSCVSQRLPDIQDWNL